MYMMTLIHGFRNPNYISWVDIILTMQTQNKHFAYLSITFKVWYLHNLSISFNFSLVGKMQ